MASAGSDERQKKLELLKIDIRSILVTSSRNGATPSELEVDYKDINGKAIPARELGFRNLKDLIEAIPDVVDVRQSYDGVKLFAKSHESTRRIESLIRRQRNKGDRPSRFGGTKQLQPTGAQHRGAARRRRGGAPRFPPSNLARPQPPMNFNGASDLRGSNFMPQRFIPPRLAASSLGKVNAAVSNAVASRLPNVARFPPLTTRFQPPTIPPRAPFGRQPLLQQPTFQPPHVVTAATPPTKPNFPVQDRAAEGPRPTAAAASTVSSELTSKQFIERISTLLDAYPKGIEMNLLEHAYASRFGEGFGSRKEQFYDACLGICNIEVDTAGRQLLVKPKSNDPTPQPKLPPLTTEKLKMFCQQVLRGHPAGITYLGFPRAFRAVSGRELDLAPYDLLSLTELVERFDDLFSSQSIKGELLLFEKSREPAVVVERKNEPVPKVNALNADDLLVDEIWLAVMNNPDHCLFVGELQDAYKILFGKPMPIGDLDEFSIKLFDYSDRFEFVYEGTLKILAQPEYKPILLSVQKLAISDKSQTIGPQASTTQQSIDYATVDDHYGVQDLPVPLACTQSGFSSEFEISVAQVETPGCFYIQLKAICEELEKLLTEVNVYYSSQSNAKTIPASLIKVGTPCACRYEEDQLWYRGLIKKVVGGECTVALVDYGTEIVVSRGGIYFLDRRFLSLPAQAIQCRLAFLSPAGETWSPEAGEVMSQACGSSVLFGEVYKMQDGVAHMFLIKRPDGGNDVYLNDVLLDANLALFNEGEVDKSNDVGSAGSNEDEEELGGIDEDLDGMLSPVGSASEDVPLATSDFDLSFEQDVMNQLRSGGLLVDASDLEVINLARTFLTRKRMDLTKMLSANGTNLSGEIVDKLAWLEKEIGWLAQFEKSFQ